MFIGRLPTTVRSLAQKNETKVVSGTYQLNSGVVEMFCSFSSLPEPVTVQWMFRPSEGLPQWREFACASKEEKKICKSEEKLVESRCTLRTNQLQMSGSYRCYATIPNQVEARYKAYSSEFNVNVVGIEEPKLIDYHLPYHREGHIELEVCANPRPELFWVTEEGILRPQERSHRFATTSLLPRKVIPRAGGPATSLPYCYATRMIVHRSHANDTFRLVVRGELETKMERINVRVVNVPKAGSRSELE
ncbi:unnamed protein product [Caenorhabditis auriculariae]|uniref:Ig-like domain-containing protein n=1 Tax=Caenorhabditis auriculariae TaxID=2777116 RepID=A0A8S1GN73_9PELO|nr:unnamed protein product [Caenorhabditis auriculariae]